MMPGFSCFGNYGGYGWIAMLASFIVIIVVVVAVIWLVQRSFPINQRYLVASQPSSREILQIRYARGEITREQFLEILNDLKE